MYKTSRRGVSGSAARTSKQALSLGPASASLDVVVVTCNRPHLLAQLLSALAGQTTSDFTLTVMDDGSAPDKMIRPQAYPIIARYVWHKKEGLHKALLQNQALALSSARNVLLLDDDCMPQYASFLEAHLRALRTHPISRGVILQQPGNLDGGPCFYTSNTGFHRKALMDVGGFDLDYDGHYGNEDRDLCMRLLAAGYKEAAPRDPDTTVWHVGRPYADGDRSWEVIGHNTELFMSKWRFDPRQREPTIPRAGESQR
jgi:GT2 family glycosyltransferase